MDVLQTERLDLVPWRAEHLPALTLLAQTPSIVRFIGHGIPWSTTRVIEVHGWALEHWAEHGFGWRLMVERATGRDVGLVSLAFAGRGTPGVGEDEHEIGWWLDPDAWGRGLVREGAAAVRDEAFARVGAPWVVARIQPANARSTAVAEALGLRLEARTRGRAGEALDVHRLAAGAES